MDSLSPPETHPTPKIRKAVQKKTVVTVKIGSEKASGKLLKNEGPPPDFWSWRKYGQKPIKGSPFPRGYYRCSTSKGCSAKKQVERCKTDGSMFIITYTSSHNHPGPSISTLSFSHQSESDHQIQPQPSDQILPDQDHDDPLNVELEKPSMEKIRGCLDEEPAKAEEEDEGINDFFDELEELPTPPSLSSFMRISYNYFDEIRIPAAPS